MNVELIRFIRPELLILIALLPPLAGLSVLALRARRQALSSFGGWGAGLVSSSSERLAARAALALFAIGAIAVALAGPYIAVTEREVRWHGIDLVIAVDVSQSMAARDVAPDRLHAARQVIETLSDGLAGSRIGLVLFGGNAVVRYPATTDPRVLALAFDNSAHAFEPTPGSSLRAGVGAALDGFAPDARDAPSPKALVLVTDGEDPAAETPDLAPLRSRNVRVFTVGIGTTAGAEIPTYDQEGRATGVLRSGGRAVVSRLDETRLRSLAEQGGGRYWRYDGAAVLDAVVAEFRAMGTTELSAGAGAVPNDLYQLFLGLALAAILLEWLLGDRRPMPFPEQRGPRRAGRRLAPERAG